MKLKIKNDQLFQIVAGSIAEFPKYTTQIINLANQNAQGTRPKVVGQMSDLIQEFSGKTIGEWEEWYKEGHPEAIDDATNKIFEMVEKFKLAINNIDRELVRKWVEDLVITKTFVGLRFQEAILAKIAEQKKQKYRLAAPEEESRGIDGFIGYTAVSIKPTSYEAKQGLVEDIGVEMVFYEKKKDGLTVQYNF